MFDSKDAKPGMMLPAGDDGYTLSLDNSCSPYFVTTAGSASMQVANGFSATSLVQVTLTETATPRNYSATCVVE